MITVKILIDSAEKVKKFSAILSRENVECDLSKPIQLKIHSDNREILDHLKEFVVAGA